MSQLLEGLNDRQIEAVTTTEGPLLVVAGAGSGKTRALTHRIAYLIKEKGVNPWNILAVTFTNKAAHEMKERLQALLHSDVDTSDLPWEVPAQPQASFSMDLPTMGTFHSICVRILRKHLHLLDYENSFVIYDAADQQILVKRIMQSLAIDEKKINPKAVLSHISQAKNELIDHKEYFRRSAHNYFTEKVAAVYEKYQRELQKSNALDFDDLIMKTVELFQTQPDVLSFFQNKFHYISVDEYQDTNKAQYVLIKLLADKHKNLCVIGDSDQSIYSWRGADIRNILEFEKDYPEAKVVKLEQNYRSTQVILDAAHHIITQNANRREKKLWTEQEGGELIQVAMARNEKDEATGIMREISSIVRTHETPNYKDFVILYRTNAQSRVIEEVFLRYGVPYKIVGGIKFYARKEIKDVLAYLKVVQNPHDSVSLLRILNIPARSIGPKTVEVVQAFALRFGLSFFEALERAQEIEGISLGKQETLLKFVKLIQKLQKANREFPASGVIKNVIEYTGYSEFLNDGSVEGEARLENVRELISVASKYNALEAGVSLSVFLEEVALIADVDKLNDDDNSVTLMTIHSAKGLEFPVVFICGLEEGIFPHSRSLLDQSEMEEERRLMYVAVTRAKERLYLLHAQQRMLYGEMKANAPSQFVTGLPDELVKTNYRQEPRSRMLKREDIGSRPIPVEGSGRNLDMPAPEPVNLEDPVLSDDLDGLKDGDKVVHEKFGEGVVVNVTGGIATIAFKSPRAGIKKLALSVAPIRVVR